MGWIRSGRARKILVAAIMGSILSFGFGLSGAWAEKAFGRKAAGQDLSLAIADVAEKAMPAVVHIEVVQGAEAQGSQFHVESDPFFRHFFGWPQTPRSYKKELRGIGTGMAIDSHGHILTNHHVVIGATRINVKMSSGEEFEAKLVGADSKTDLAAIRIKPPAHMPFLDFGNSDTVRVGEWVTAIGNPRGFEQTVTTGIISAKHRAGILDPPSCQDDIQTDAAVNPGNSGGPLLNLSGEVVGVNAAIVSESGGVEGLGFAIPSNMAMNVADALIRNGKVVRGWLGVSVQEITASTSRSLNLKVLKGALVAEVLAGGPAEKAGMRRGDVIVSLNGTLIESANDFRNRIAATPVGKKVQIGILRRGERMTLEANVETYKPDSRLAVLELKNKLGIEVREISGMDARRRNLDSREGVLLTQVDPNGPAGRVGLEPGDIIYQINNQSIRGLKDYARIMEQVQSEEEILLLVRDSRMGEIGYISLVAQ